MPRLSLLLVVVALLAAIVGATYALRFDPELAFWTEASKRKLSWVDEMRAKHGHVIGVVGGSTTAFAIDAQMLEKDYGLPVANLGLHADMGPSIFAWFGFSNLQRGDILILSIEPSLLNGDTSARNLGIRFALALGKPEILKSSGSSMLRLLNPIVLQPGGYHVMTMIGKVLLGLPSYRYRIEDSVPGGLQVTNEKRLIDGLGATESAAFLRLSPSSHKLLKRIQTEAASRGIKVFYMLPWMYAPELTADALRENNLRMLDQISEYLPVLRDEECGVHTNPNDFADTPQHLTHDAAQYRSRVFAESLRKLPRKQTYNHSFPD
jgi:hypothetical protein